MITQKIKISSYIKKYDILCDFYLPENMQVKKIIIACHGFGGDKNSSAIISLVKHLIPLNIGVIAFDFPGHGISKTSGYDFTLENCINDVNKIERYIENNFNNIEIGFFATSFGAYVLLLKLSRYRKIYNSIVLRCPAINMKTIFEESILKIDIKDFLNKGECELGYERKIIITKNFYNELVENDIFNIYDTSNKICIIHGTKDNIAPIKDSIKFQEKFKDRVKLYKIIGADHRFKKEGELEEVINIATNYILKN